MFTALIVFAFELSTSRAAIPTDAAHAKVRACQDLRDKTFSVDTKEPYDTNQESTNTLEMDGIKIVAERHTLMAYTSSVEPDDIVSVKQMDYGVVTGIFKDRGLGIIAIGDQTSYRVKIKTIAGKAKFYYRQKLTMLYRNRCSFVTQLWGSCEIANTYFSRELSMAFASGYDHFGARRSYAFGSDSTTSVKELRIPTKGPAFYFFDVPGSGGAAFREYQGLPHGNFYFFDGNEFVDCK